MTRILLTLAALTPSAVLAHAGDHSELPPTEAAAHFALSPDHMILGLAAVAGGIALLRVLKRGRQ